MSVLAFPYFILESSSPQRVAALRASLFAVNNETCRNLGRYFSDRWSPRPSSSRGAESMARMREDEWSMSHNLLQWLLAPCDCCADDESHQDGVYSSLSAFLQRLHVCLSDEQSSRVDAECVPNCLAVESIWPWFEARSGRPTDMNASSQLMDIGLNLFASTATVIGRARLIMLENDHTVARHLEVRKPGGWRLESEWMKG